jgi:hypothetical protein
MLVRSVLEVHLLQGHEFGFAVVKAALETVKNAGSLMDLKPTQKRAVLKAAQVTNCLSRKIEDIMNNE